MVVLLCRSDDNANRASVGCVSDDIGDELLVLDLPCDTIDLVESVVWSAIEGCDRSLVNIRMSYDLTSSPRSRPDACGQLISY